MIRAIPLIALMLATPAASQILSGDDSNAPVSWDADHLELQSRADRVVIWGSVKITQGSMKLDADRVTVAYSQALGPEAPSPDINRLDATGNVAFTKGDQIARGNMAIYDLDQRIITFLGNVELSQGANRLSGARLVIDLNSGLSILDGRSSATATGGAGRVTATFNPPRQGRQPTIP